MKTLLIVVLALFGFGCAKVPPPATPCAAPVSVYRGVIEVSRVCPGPALSSEVYRMRAKTSERVSIGYQGQDPLTHIRSPFLR